MRQGVKKCLHISMGLYFFSISTVNILINKIHAAFSHADILSIKIFGMRIKLFTLEFVEKRMIENKFLCMDARTCYKLMEVNLNSWNLRGLEGSRQ